MSERSARFFDEMNILQSEKDKRVKSCDFLEKKLKEEFLWFREHSIRKTEYENHLVKIIAMWMVFVGYATEKQIADMKEFLEIYNISLSALGIDEDEDDDEDDQKPDPQKVKSISKEIERMAKKIEEENEKNPDNDYYTSEDRAYYIARDYTNKIFNVMIHDDAVSEGLKFHVWRTENDKYVRKSHVVAEGQIQKINEPFIINGYEMMYPMDDSMGADMNECAGCRCTEEFF